VLVAGLCIGLLSGQSALAVTIKNGITTIFMDDFENDTLGMQPTISPPDIGIGYNKQNPTIISAVQNDTVSATLEARAGQYWNFTNDTFDQGDVIAQFPRQSTGTVQATFAANVIGAGSGGSLRMVFMQGTNPLNRSTAFGVHAGYLYTGSWFETHSIPLPAGLNSNDVVMAYYDGSYNFLAKQGGTVLEGAAIDGLMFGSNGGGGSRGYVDFGVPPPPPILNVGSQRELFVDNYLVDSISGTAVLDLKKPQAQEVALHTDAPWEGNTSAYFTVFKDGPLYRMYYRGSHFENGSFVHPETTAYAESTDGINWTKPNLGIVEYNGSTQNNLVWKSPGSHNFTPFLDANPNAAPDAKYKALAKGAVSGGAHGLYAFKSPDGINWSLMSQQPVITEGDFDSQNLAFWDPHREQYVDYHRQRHAGVRDIKTATSDDFLNWTDPDWLVYPSGTPTEHLYTNAVHPYERAPHLLLGFPTRYNPNTSQVEPILMSSRNGVTFDRWQEALIPITAPEDRDRNRSNYMAWGLVELPHSDRELSVYATEAYYEGPDSRIRRFTYRVDGFVSVNASGGIGELLTKPFVFEGDQLEVNFATFDQGTLRAELQDADGNAIPGFTLADAEPVSGDKIEQVLSWSGGWDVSALAGAPVRLRFELNDADLYAFQFSGATNIFHWAGGIVGDWDLATNWSPRSGAPPNSRDHTAIFDNTATGPTNVSTMSDVTVNRIEIDHASHPYIVSGSGTVNLETDSMGTGSRIDVVNGNHQLQAKFALIDDATIDIGNGSSLEFVNRLDLNGNTLTQSGAGTLVISNTLNTGGGTVLNHGGVLSGGGTIGGEVINDGGTISPGNSVSGLSNSQAVVPEPGALGLLLLAGVACFLLRWNQVRRSD